MRYVYVLGNNAASPPLNSKRTTMKAMHVLTYNGGILDT